MGVGGVAGGVACVVTPSLAPTAVKMQQGARRTSIRRDQTPTERAVDVSKQDSLGDRASSKLTLDDELYDILYAFGETDAFLGGKSDKQRETDEEGNPLTRQALLERIRQKKEVIGKLRCQAWSMARKRRTLKLAQKYLEQNESKVSRSHLYMEELRKRVRLIKRSFSNFKTYLIPWEAKIKRIESHFGSVVSSYFTFLRWIVFVNVVITLLAIAFVVLPEALADSVADEHRQNRTKTRKQIPLSERVHADQIAVVWHYDGYLRYSPLFYGWYSDDPFLGTKIRYALPLAYFMVTLFIFAYSFFAILRKMAANARMSKLSGSKAEQYIFNWKLFTGWDYTIGNSDTASNTVMAVVIKLRESIADSRVEGHGKFRCLQFSLRVFANLVICAMLAFSIYCISFAVQKSQTAVEQEGNLFTKNQVPSVVSTITHVFPMIFDLIGRIENYHPRTALRAHLGRVLVLYVLNYLTLIVALFDKMDALRKTGYSHDPHRLKRQQGGWNPNVVRPPPYASRTFENRQMSNFLARNTERFQSQSQRTTRSYTTPYTVAPQYGPFNVNNPNAYLRNGTPIRDFESQRVGPQMLPIFTPPPRTYPPHSSGHVGQQYGGPDFEGTKVYTRSTPLPRVRTKPPWEWSTTIPPLSEDGGTRMVKPDPTQAGMGNSSLLGDSISIDSSNGTMQMGETAPRKSVSDEYHNTDICWETIIGQEIVKLVTMDLIFTILSILVIDFLRGVWIKYCSSWWCWDIETTFPEYGEFKVAENVLHIINNQGMIWLGLFFAPLLPALNNIKLVILMYIRGWAVMTCNVPAREIFRASRSSNFYLLILLLWLLLCTLPVGFVIASTKPSRACGPFARHEYFYTVVTREIEKRVDTTLLNYVKHVASPGVVIPIILFLMLIIYFLVSLVRGLREANTDLQQQLVHERTEEKKKIFELAGGGKKKLDKDKDKRKTIEYVPVIEQRRRETWRVYHDGEGDRILASDSSEESEMEEDDWKVQQTATRPFQFEETTQENVQVMAFHPSLGSLIENKELEEEESEIAHVHYNKSIFVGSSGSQVHLNTSSDNCSLISRSVIQVATPEEIRALLRPLVEAHYGLPSSCPRFPADVFSSPTIVNAHLHRSSKCSSFVSLYESAKEDPLYSKVLSTAAVRENVDKKAEVHRRDAAEPVKLRAKRESSAEKQFAAETSTKPASKFVPTDISAQFLPWPSIEEAKNIREKMKQKAPLPLKKVTEEEQKLPETLIEMDNMEGVKEYRPPVPIHRKFQTAEVVESSSSNNEDKDCKRFRISVSPTKTIQSNQGNEATRSLIHQASSSSSIPTQSRQSDINRNPIPVAAQSPRAPRVQFGEDDSPRLLD